APFQELLAEDPDAAGTWSNLGLLELSAEQRDAAATAFRRAVTINPASGEAWQGLGVALIDQNRDLAIDAWRHAERLQPRDYDLLFNLGMVLADSAHPGEAVPYLKRFLQA